MTIMRIGSDLISIAKNNTTYTNDSTRKILDNFGNISINIGKKIKNFEIQIPALKSKMGGRTYYCFTLNPEHLLKISYVHERSKEDSFLELSDSYQRMINKSRIRKVEEYIRGGRFLSGKFNSKF